MEGPAPSGRTPRAHQPTLRVLTLVLVLMAIGAAFLGSGAVVGTPVNEAAGG